jgi:hypothetical protein
MLLQRFFFALHLNLKDAATTSPSEVAERVGLLLQLKSEPTSLRGSLLASIKSHISNAIHEEAVQTAPAKEEGEEEENEEDDGDKLRLLKRVTALTKRVVNPLVEHVTTFNNMFQCNQSHSVICHLVPLL